jgi:hypothetical protein
VASRGTWPQALRWGNMISAEKAKRHIDEAFKNREGRVAILVHEGFGNALDLLDEQSAAVLEAMLERAKQLHQSGRAAEHRSKLRVAIIEYLEERLHEAVVRERQLAQAITGAEDLSNDYTPGIS